MTPDYAEPLLLARKALATYEAAILHGLASDAAKAAVEVIAAGELLALYANRQK